jgi:hypothetical protein
MKTWLLSIESYTINHHLYLECNRPGRKGDICVYVSVCIYSVGMGNCRVRGGRGIKSGAVSVTQP